MKVLNERYQITFKFTNHDEYVKLLSTLNNLVTCCCDRHEGTCKRCCLSKIYDDNGIDLCDIITNTYFDKRQLPL